MKDDLDRDDLLNDVLEEVAPPAFRARAIEAALSEVRSGRRLRRIRRGVLRVACTAVVALLAVGLLALRSPRNRHSPVIANSLLVHSRPLSPDMIIRTRPNAVDVLNFGNTSLSLVRSSAENYWVVGDAELLTLLAGRPAALVRHGPFETELVFVHPADQEGFPLQ